MTFIQALCPPSWGGGVIADGLATATIEIQLLNSSMDPVVGLTPTFSATGSANTYGVCSASDSNGKSTCTLSSTVAEVKTLQLLTPVSVAGGTVAFIAGPPDAAKSSLDATSPITADGIATSTITLTLKDAIGNVVSGFNAEDLTLISTGSGNTLTDFSGSTNSLGQITATLASTTAGIKTLSISADSSGDDLTAIASITAVFVAESASKLVFVSPPTTVQSGTASSSFTVQLQDSEGNPVSVSGKSITVGAYTSNTCSTLAGGIFAASSSATESTNSSGVASFTSVTYTGSTGTVYLCAIDVANGYTAASQAVTVTAGTASMLALVTHPSSVQSGVASGAFTIQVEDISGNAVTISGKSITVGAYTSSACSTPATGTFSAVPGVSVATGSSGIASFTSMTYTGSTGTVYLCATDTSDGYVLAAQPVTITAGNA